MKTAFCTECRDFVEYDTEERIVIEEFKNKMCLYREIIVTCPICGSEIYVGEIDDENMKRLWKAYREED